MIFTYRFVFSHDKQRSREFRTTSGVVRRGMQKLPRGSSLSYVIHAEGSGPSRHRTFNDTSDRLYELLLLKRIGITYSVIAYADTRRVDAVHFRMLRSLPPMSDVEGTDMTRRWCGMVEFLWPDARFAGTIACKVGDHPVGAAADYFPPASDVEQGKEMHEFAIDNAEDLGTKYSIWMDEIWLAGPPWTNGARGRQPYHGATHLHHHWSGRESKCGLWCVPGYGSC